MSTRIAGAGPLCAPTRRANAAPRSRAAAVAGRGLWRAGPTRAGSAPRPLARARAAAGSARPAYDVLTLSNLCADVLVKVPELPTTKSPELLARLERSAPSPDGSWEAGGNSNVLLSAARLGLRAGALGVLGDDAAGAFLTGILDAEGIAVLPLRAAGASDRVAAAGSPPAGPTSASAGPGSAGPTAASTGPGSARLTAAFTGPESACPAAASAASPPAGPTSASAASLPAGSTSASAGPGSAEPFRTLRCFVLLDPRGQHAFCSSYDFGPWPLLGRAPPAPAALAALRSTRSLFVNGFCFDDLPAEEVLTSVEIAKRAGAAVIFDPGPRAATFQTGGRREALRGALEAADVVSLTEEEALDVVGTADAREAASAILARSACDWCVVKCGARGALLRTRDGREVDCPAFSVEVADTVGCGDSLAAALALAKSRCGPRDLEAAMALACAVGAASATRRGAGRAVARRADVRAILRDAVGAGRPDARGALELLDRVAAEGRLAAPSDASRGCSEPSAGGSGFVRA